MDSDRLNKWLTLGANLGVLIGIILLIFELDQNRDLMRAQTRHQLAQGIVDIEMSGASNAQLMDILVRAEEGEQLTTSEDWQYRARTNALFRYWENVHYQFRQGLYDETEFSKQMETWGVTLQNYSHIRRYWCEVSSRYSPDFAAELDSLLINHAC